MRIQSVKPKEKTRPLNGVYGALSPPQAPALQTEGLLYTLYLLKAPPRTTPIAAPSTIPT
jgi:hypothetical protein